MNEVGFVKMDDESFKRLSSYITFNYGIKLPLEKKTMLESRLNRKMRSMGMHSYKEFLDYIFSDHGKSTELYNVIDLITTNKTDFFRENAHFQFLSSEFLPYYQENFKRSNLKIWSSACSTGEEPYTMMMILEEYKKRHPEVNYNIYASDISRRVMEHAYHGIYEREKIDGLPLELKLNYFLQSKKDNTVRIKPVFRKKITYKRINLIESNYGFVKEDMDIIFCRNVLIYFDKNNQEKVLQKLCTYLRPNGILLLGHSESIMGMQVPLTQLRPTIYQKK